MSMQNTTSQAAPHGEVDLLGNMIDVPLTDTPSWYQRNSGALPKSERGMGESQRRSQLPSPTAPEALGFIDRVKERLTR